MGKDLSEEWSTNFEGLKEYISELKAQQSNMIKTASELDSKLQNLDAEIAKLLIVYQKALHKKKQEIESLREGSVEPVTFESKVKVDTRFKRVYTDEQRKQMVDIYISCNCKRKQTLQAVREQLGVNISDTGLVAILEEENVFRRTYHKRKRRAKKKAKR